MAKILDDPLISFTHDLNNLLVGIDGYGRLLTQEEELSAEGKKFLTKLLELVDTATDRSIEFQRSCGVRVLEQFEPAFRSEKKTGTKIRTVKDFRVLVIDDDPAVRELVQIQLKERGFEVVGAADGNEGLRLFQESEFDCVLLDLSMPIMSGNLVFARLKAIAPSTPLIVMSALISDERLQSLSQIQSTNFLQKPFHEVELVHMVTELCKAEEESLKMVENV